MSVSSNNPYHELNPILRCLHIPYQPGTVKGIHDIIRYKNKNEMLELNHLSKSIEELRKECKEYQTFTLEE